MKAKLVYDIDPHEAGAIIDHPDAWMLVDHGSAEAADDECAAKVKEFTEARTAKRNKVWSQKLKNAKIATDRETARVAGGGEPTRRARKLDDPKTLS